MKNNTSVFDGKTQAKINKLTKEYKDKSLSRQERQEAFRELARVKYIADPRPSISVRKQAKLDAAAWFLDALLFGCITFAKRQMNEGMGTVFSIILSAVMVITVMYAISVERKYKKELDDELSLNSKKRASELAGLTMIIIAAAVGMLVFTMLEKSFTLNSDNWLGLFCTVVFLYSFFEKLFFLIVEGKDSAEAEEDE